MIHTSNLYAFVLGREQKIALMELESVLRSFCFDENNPDKNVGSCFPILSLDKNVLFINIENKKIVEVSRLIHHLGGTIKIYKIKAPREANIKTQILDIISNQYKNGKLKFGISNYSKKSLFKNLGFEIKSSLKKRKISSRFIQEKKGNLLSSAESYNAIFNKKGTEVGVFDDYIGVLIAVSNPNQWSKRDYGKPKGDRFSGMIPPKLARMMINIAVKISPTGLINNKPVIFDPFCGSGNILIEAASLGYKIAGSDISKKAVEDTKENLKWLNNVILNDSGESRPDPSSDISSKSTDKQDDIGAIIKLADATDVDFSKIFPSSTFHLPTIVVAEPYLGTPKKQVVDNDKISKEFDEIKKLYLGFFENIYSQKDKINLAKICLVFPVYELKGKENRSLFEEIVDEIENLGYTVSCSFKYGRDYQIVKREVVIFKVKKSPTKLPTRQKYK